SPVFFNIHMYSSFSTEYFKHVIVHRKFLIRYFIYFLVTDFLLDVHLLKNCFLLLRIHVFRKSDISQRRNIRLFQKLRTVLGDQSFPDGFFLYTISMSIPRQFFSVIFFYNKLDNLIYRMGIWSNAFFNFFFLFLKQSPLFKFPGRDFPVRYPFDINACRSICSENTVPGGCLYKIPEYFPAVLVYFMGKLRMPLNRPHKSRARLPYSFHKSVLG